LNTLSWIFVAGALICFAVWGWNLWNTLLRLFHTSPTLMHRKEDAQRHALLERKHILLRQLKDIEYEKALGKISDQDAHALEEGLRREAKDILVTLDSDLEPYRKQALALVEEARKKKDA
jgi:hypothetical protein